MCRRKYFFISRTCNLTIGQKKRRGSIWKVLPLGAKDPSEAKSSRNRRNLTVYEAIISKTEIKIFEIWYRCRISYAHSRKIDDPPHLTSATLEAHTVTLTNLKIFIHVNAHVKYEVSTPRISPLVQLSLCSPYEFQGALSYGWERIRMKDREEI